jgi:hypothetical protein
MRLKIKNCKSIINEELKMVVHYEPQVWKILTVHELATIYQIVCIRTDRPAATKPVSVRIERFRRGGPIPTLTPTYVIDVENVSRLEELIDVFSTKDRMLEYLKSKIFFKQLNKL